MVPLEEMHFNIQNASNWLWFIYLAENLIWANFFSKCLKDVLLLQAKIVCFELQIKCGWILLHVILSRQLIVSNGMKLWFAAWSPPAPVPYGYLAVAALSCMWLHKSPSGVTSSSISSIPYYFIPFFNIWPYFRSNFFLSPRFSLKCWFRSLVLSKNFPNFQPKFIHSQFIPICSCVSMAFSLNSCFPCLIFTFLECLQRMGVKTETDRWLLLNL